MSRPPGDFLHAAFAPLAEGEKVALGIASSWPRNDGSRGLGPKPRRWRAGKPVPPLGLHYNCCAFKVEAAHAALHEATRTFVIMLDDVGDMPEKSKAPLDRVLALPAATRPHAIIATRRDAEGHINTQCAWFINPVSPDAARALVKAAAQVGWCDPGCSGGVRWARPPGSLKIDGNGFPAELIASNFDAPRIGIGALAEALGVPDFMADVQSPRRAGREALGDPPDAALVRAAMAAIANDLNRDEWVRLGLALKACCGQLPALSDAEGYVLFDAFSRRHVSYDEKDARTRWRSFRPSRSGFGTIVRLATRCGWNLRRAEQALQGAAARREAAGHAACLADIDGIVRLLESQFKSQPETQSGLASSDYGVPHAAVHRAR